MTELGAVTREHADLLGVVLAGLHGLDDACTTRQAEHDESLRQQRAEHEAALAKQQRRSSRGLEDLREELAEAAAGRDILIIETRTSAEQVRELTADLDAARQELSTQRTAYERKIATVRSAADRAVTRERDRADRRVRDLEATLHRLLYPAGAEPAPDRAHAHPEGPQSER